LDHPALPFALPLLAWLLWAWAANRIADNPRDDALYGILVPVARVYARLLHRTRHEGLEHVRAAHARTPGCGLIIIANHTAGVDPVLIQPACPFFIRWMMTSEMRLPILEPFWVWMDILFVGADAERKGVSELNVVREAVRHTRNGAVLGLFPEGRIARPRGVLCPIQPGIGLLVTRSGGLVLPVVVTGTPDVSTPWASLFWPSRATVRFMPTIDYSGWRPAAVVSDLSARYARWLNTRDPLIEPTPNDPVGSTDTRGPAGVTA
jgi:1-acyl-sn-glycerol-3-phosphate acyltransferase